MKVKIKIFKLKENINLPLAKDKATGDRGMRMSTCIIGSYLINIKGIGNSGELDNVVFAKQWLSDSDETDYDQLSIQEMKKKLNFVKVF